MEALHSVVAGATREFIERIDQEIRNQVKHDMTEKPALCWEELHSSHWAFLLQTGELRGSRSGFPGFFELLAFRTCAAYLEQYLGSPFEAYRVNDEARGFCWSSAANPSLWLHQNATFRGVKPDVSLTSGCKGDVLAAALEVCVNANHPGKLLGEVEKANKCLSNAPEDARWLVVAFEPTVKGDPQAAEEAVGNETRIKLQVLTPGDSGTPLLCGLKWLFEKVRRDAS